MLVVWQNTGEETLNVDFELLFFLITFLAKHQCSDFDFAFLIGKNNDTMSFIMSDILQRFLNHSQHQTLE